MKNIEIAIEAIEAERKLELVRMNEYDELIARLKKLQTGDLNNDSNSKRDLISPNIGLATLDPEKFFAGYPLEMRLSEKLKFISTALNRPFRALTCLDLVELKEGKAKRDMYETRMSQQLNYQVKNMTYIGQKYGSNKYTFYFKKEWCHWNGTEYNILPEYEITPEEFKAAGIPEHKRKDFKWIISNAVKNLLLPKD
jgi:hypothetical protein